MINEQLFFKWADKKIGQPIVKGDQIRFNSPFCEDSKHHLYCNIKKFWKGVFNCFKSNNKGTVVALVMKLEECQFEKAMQILGIAGKENSDDFFQDEKSIDFDSLNKEEFETIKMPEGVVKINSAPRWWKDMANNYLNNRNINSDLFFIGTDGRMKSRIVIPYYDRKGNLIYYNGRALFQSKLRYLGPHKDECNVGKADVIFFRKWNENNQKIYVCEGEFDSISLSESNIMSCAVGGKYISVKQATVLANKEICLSFDNDEAGKSSVENSFKLLKSFGCQVTKVCPPLDIKDWNEFLVKFDKNMLYQYIKLAETQMDG